MSERVIEKARKFAQSHFADDGSGHDWWHVYRVWNTARHLADAEGAWPYSSPARMPSHEIAKGRKFNPSTDAPGVVNKGNNPRIRNSQRKAYTNLPTVLKGIRANASASRQTIINRARTFKLAHDAVRKNIKAITSLMDGFIRCRRDEPGW